MKPLIKNTAIFIAVFVVALKFKYKNFEYNLLQEQILIGLLIVIVIDFIIRTLVAFRRNVFIRTKFDLFFQLSNILIGICCITFSVLYWESLKSTKWLLIIFSFLGLAYGIFYQNRIKLTYSFESLTIDYKFKKKIILEKPNSVILKNNLMIIENSERIIEVNDIKFSKSNISRILNFFLSKYSLPVSGVFSPETSR